MKMGVFFAPLPIINQANQGALLSDFHAHVMVRMPSQSSVVTSLNFISIFVSIITY